MKFNPILVQLFCMFTRYVFQVPHNFNVNHSHVLLTRNMENHFCGQTDEFIVMHIFNENALRTSTQIECWQRNILYTYKLIFIIFLTWRIDSKNNSGKENC